MDELYPYYVRELAFIREMAADFAENHREVASRLRLGKHRCDDPHVERLIQAFSLIAARLHHRIDSDFPEITQSLLNVVYPYFLRIVPPASIAQFEVRSDKSTEPIIIGDKETVRVAGSICRFRTSYRTEVWPVKVSDLEIRASAELNSPQGTRSLRTGPAIVVRLSAGCNFSDLMGLRSLRFCLRGAGDVPYSLYELIFNHCKGVLVQNAATPRTGGKSKPLEPIELPAAKVVAVGFRDDEGLLPYEGNAFTGFRWIQEYLAFPEKFLFWDLTGLEALQGSEFGSEIDLVILLDDQSGFDSRFRALQSSVSADNFVLGCAPVVNLFSKTAEPLRVDHTKSVHRIVPDLQNPESAEIFTIDSISSRSFGARQNSTYRPLFQMEHGLGQSTDRFWHAVRCASGRKGDLGTEIDVSLVDLALGPDSTVGETLHIELTCTNRDMVKSLPLRYAFDEIQVADSRVRSRLLQSPTRPWRPPLGRNLDWRMVSRLGADYLSLLNVGAHDRIGGSQSASALREVISLHDFSDDPVIREKIQGIRRVSSRPATAKVRMLRDGEQVPVLCHGLAVDIDFDEEPFLPSGLFLFTAVLERLLGLNASLNSFTELTATTQEGRRILRQWPPRAGNRLLL